MFLSKGVHQFGGVSLPLSDKAVISGHEAATAGVWRYFQCQGAARAAGRRNDQHATQHVDDPSLRIEAVEFAVTIRVYIAKDCQPTSGTGPRIASA